MKPAEFKFRCNDEELEAAVHLLHLFPVLIFDHVQVYIDGQKTLRATKSEGNYLWDVTVTIGLNMFPYNIAGAVRAYKNLVNYKMEEPDDTHGINRIEETYHSFLINLPDLVRQTVRNIERFVDWYYKYFNEVPA